MLARGRGSTEISILLASSDSFNVKSDIIHTFFSLFWLQILNLPASLQNKNTRIGPFPWKRTVLQNPDRERTNQSTGLCLRLALPYNKYILLDGLSYNTRGYFASCVVFFRAPQGRGKLRAMRQNVREYYMLNHLIRDLLFRYKKVLFWFNFIS